MIQGLSNSVRSVRPVLLALICVVGCAISSGCATRVVDGDSVTLDSSEKIRLLMPPFFNATNDDHAGRALSELTGSALVDRGIPLYQTEELLLSTQEETAAGPDGRYQELANTVGATHLLIGTVHEYRYKTDLDGDPAVGITIRIVDARDGRTVWQGSSSNIGYAFASVTSASQRAVRRLVRRIPILEEQFESVSEPIEKSKVESDETTSVEEADSSHEADSHQEADLSQEVDSSQEK